MKLSSDDLRQMSENILKDVSFIDKLSEEELIEVKKYINPLGYIVKKNTSYAALSLINWREDYFKRFHMTSLIGYLFKIAEEYEPSKELEHIRADYLQDLETYSQHPEKLSQIKSTYENYKDTVTKIARSTIKRFLQHYFLFDPNTHIRAATSRVSDDDDRKTVWPTKEDIVEHANKISNSISEKSELTKQYLIERVKHLYSIVNELKKVSTTLQNISTDEDNIAIISYQISKINTLQSDLQLLADPLLNNECKEAMNDVPCDVYYHFNRYITNNYAKLLEITRTLYNNKYDIEYSVILHDIFDNIEDANNFLLKHKQEFRTDVQIIETGGVTLLGPYKENLDRIDVYDKNTEILKRIMDQAESDHKLGKDLMEKRVKTCKTRNIEEEGPDSPEHVKYMNAMQIAKDLSGVNRVLSPEEKAKLEEAIKTAKKIKEDFEIPENSIQVDMYYPDQSDGDLKLKRTKFYTKEEAPLHMLQNSEFKHKYQ